MRSYASERKCRRSGPAAVAIRVVGHPTRHQCGSQHSLGCVLCAHDFLYGYWIETQCSWMCLILEFVVQTTWVNKDNSYSNTNVKLP